MLVYLAGTSTAVMEMNTLVKVDICGELGQIPLVLCLYWISLDELLDRFSFNLRGRSGLNAYFKYTYSCRLVPSLVLVCTFLPLVVTITSAHTTR